MSVAETRITEPVLDDENFIAEASLDIRGNDLVMTWVRHRGLRHTDDGSILFARSRDRGETWDDSSIVVAMAERPTWGFTMCGVKILRDGTILAFAHANTEYDAADVGPLRSRGSYVARSVDGGRSWSEPERILAWPLRTIATWDNPIELEDGSLLLPVHGAVEGAQLHTYRDPTRSALLESKDAGRSWHYIGTIGYDPAGIHQLMEPGVARRGDGTMVALMRQHYEYCGARPPGGYLFASHSTDTGATWSPFARTQLWGYPADPVLLSDGTVFCAYGFRGDPLSIRFAVSADGISWALKDSGLLYDASSVPVDGPPTKHSINTGYRHIGYPSAVAMDNDEILVAFHSFNSERKQNVLLAKVQWRPE